MKKRTYIRPVKGIKQVQPSYPIKMHERFND